MKKQTDNNFLTVSQMKLKLFGLDFFASRVRMKGKKTEYRIGFRWRDDMKYKIILQIGKNEKTS